MIAFSPKNKKPKTVASAGIRGFQLDGAESFFTKEGNIMSRRVGDHILYTAHPPIKFQHPWFCRVTWVDDLEVAGGEKESCWALGVTPGFVNGIDPVCPTAKELDVFSEKLDINGIPIKEYGQAGLLDSPLVPLKGKWTQAEGMPYRHREYFKAIGLMSESRNRGGEGRAVSEIDRRFPFSIDVYVGVFINQVEAKHALTYDGWFGLWPSRTYSQSAPSLKRPILQTGTNPLKLPIDPGEEPDENSKADYLNIATLYAFSSVEDAFYSQGKFVAPFGGFSPKKTSRIFVCNDVFWNVEHRSKDLEPIQPNKPFVINPMGLGLSPLGGSLISGFVSSINSSLNAMQDRTEKTPENTGVFWSV